MWKNIFTPLWVRQDGIKRIIIPEAELGEKQSCTQTGEHIYFTKIWSNNKKQTPVIPLGAGRRVVRKEQENNYGPIQCEGKADPLAFNGLHLSQVPLSVTIAKSNW